jgi:DNA-binding FadR family transcriptional regulator
MTITPIARATAATACADALRGHILRGDFPPGDRLPAERELCAQLGVSRITLRSALATLAAERLIDVRPGSGAVVADYLHTAGPELLAAWLAMAASDDGAVAIADLLAIRRALARVVLERLERQADKRSIAGIRDAVDELAAVVAAGAVSAAIARADLNVTRAILTAIESPVLQLCMNPIATVVMTLTPLRDAIYAQPEENVAGYRQLLALLAERRREGLADAVSAILEDNDERTLRRLRRRAEKKS